MGMLMHSKRSLVAGRDGTVVAELVSTLCAGAAVEAQISFIGSGELHCSGLAVPFFLPCDYLRGPGGPQLPITRAGIRRRSFTLN